MLMAATARRARTMNLEREQKEGRTFPDAFKEYLLKGYPSGRNWVPPVPKESHLRREYQSLHYSQRGTGGRPDLLASFVQDLDNGMHEEMMHKERQHFAAQAEIVAGIIKGLEGSQSSQVRKKMECLAYFQLPPSLREDLRDWCELRALDERTAYRHRDEAILAVWLLFVARCRGYGVANA